jgi:outer membrane protein W
MAKFRVPVLPLVKPYVGAGPNFRVAGSDLSFVSSKGLAVGLGLELKISKLRIAPEVRYTRWGSDNKATVGTLISIASNTNQGEFLVGISF